MNVSILNQYLDNKLQLFKARQIKYYYYKWVNLTSNLEVLTTLTGLKLKFIDSSPPQQQSKHEAKFSEEQEKFVSEEITRLLDEGAIKECQHEENECISSIFLTPKSDGSFRLILNLKKIK